jgi:hypothetical protein
VNYKIECVGELAWSNSTRQAGIRFKDIASESLNQLKAWLQSQAPDLEADDPPVPCKLTDLSAAGAYLETAAPFPVASKVALAIQAEPPVHVFAIVRVTHPEAGMGVEFLRTLPQHQQQLQKFIDALVNSGESLPEILVQPEGLGDDEKPSELPVAQGNVEDPLLALFLRNGNLAPEVFREELRKQRGQHQAQSAAAAV